MARIGADRREGWRHRGSMAPARLCLPFLLATAGALAPCALAHATEDCMPLAGPPGFRALQAAERRDHDAIEFTVQRGGVAGTVSVSGAKL
jgi:hypothetical protein